MAGIPDHQDPKTEEEKEIAVIMTFCRRLHDEIRKQCPWLPENAVSVGMINYGAQVGCKAATPAVVSEYMRGVANVIWPVQ